MAPELHRPPLFPQDTIQRFASSVGLPTPRRIKVFKGDATYHSIYILNFDKQWDLKPAKTRETDGSTDLFLRVSGKHLPRIKTINEVAVMKWVRENTEIPVPAVVRFDASEDNVLGHEFTLLEKAEGICLHTVWKSLTSAAQRSALEQIADYLGKIHAHTFEWIGGMQLSETGDSIVPGPLLDEAAWQAPDVANYWPEGESVSTLDISGPYESYTALCAAEMDRVIYAIGKHDSLAWIRDLVPRLQAFVDMLSNDTERVREMKLNDSKVVLAHRGLNLANIMFNVRTNKITAILD